MLMSKPQVLFIAGTHGNEINASWLINQWIKKPEIINVNDFEVVKVIGNPEALHNCKRYLDCDLNRSFREELLNDDQLALYEIERARELLLNFGPKGLNACQIAIDLHSTTSSMGTSIVVYGRRPADLAIASLLQSRIGFPIYLHEGDDNQKGFLVESWPCGLVIEIGPVPQGLLNAKVINQTKLALNIFLEELGKLNTKKAFFPDKIRVHRHVKSIDYPRTVDGEIEAFVHPSRQGSDWHPIENGAPLFLKSDGSVIRFEGSETFVPVFINEAAYMEKNIAMSFTKRETWEFSKDWESAIYSILSL